MKRIILFIMMAFVFLSGCSTSKTEFSWSVTFVKWNGKVYIVSSEKVENIGKKIGTINYMTDREKDMKKFPDNSSNYFKVGTNLYEIQNISTSLSIAVAEKDGAFLKANVEVEK